jgi:peptidoglycan/xylan/chitin deacetylase (PgdA/CDA1 family)
MFVDGLKALLYSGARYSGLNWAFRHNLGSRSPLVLCYHGVVGEDRRDQHFLYRNTVSRRQFQLQLEFLNRHFHPISLGGLIDHVQRGVALKPRSVLVTFDDGYRNNLTNAAPLLLRYGVPALFNITTGYIGRADVLWPDEVNLRVLHWPDSSMPYPSHEGGFSKVDVPVTADQRIIAAERIRAICKTLSEQDRLAYLDSLRQVACPALEQRDRELYDFLTWDDVRSLVKAGFDIGSHTVNHPILTQIGATQLERELVESKVRIEAETGKPCTCLVYPNGQIADFNREVEEAAGRAGYVLAFTATGSYTSLNDGHYALSRVGVPGQAQDYVFESRVSGLHTWIKKIS